MVMNFVTCGRAEVSVIVPAALKLIILGVVLSAFANVIASRNDPTPLSSVFRTVNVAASASRTAQAHERRTSFLAIHSLGENVMVWLVGNNPLPARQRQSVWCRP